MFQSCALDSLLVAPGIGRRRMCENYRLKLGSNILRTYNSFHPPRRHRGVSNSIYQLALPVMNQRIPTVSVRLGSRY